METTTIFSFYSKTDNVCWFLILETWNNMCDPDQKKNTLSTLHTRNVVYLNNQIHLQKLDCFVFLLLSSSIINTQMDVHLPYWITIVLCFFPPSTLFYEYKKKKHEKNKKINPKQNHFHNYPFPWFSLSFPYPFSTKSHLQLPPGSMTRKYAFFLYSRLLGHNPFFFLFIFSQKYPLFIIGFNIVLPPS